MSRSGDSMRMGRNQTVSENFKDRLRIGRFGNRMVDNCPFRTRFLTDLVASSPAKASVLGARSSSSALSRWIAVQDVNI